MPGVDRECVTHHICDCQRARLERLEKQVAAMLELLRRIASIDPRVTTTVYNWCHYCDGREYPNEVPARPLQHASDCPWVAAQSTVALTADRADAGEG